MDASSAWHLAIHGTTGAGVSRGYADFEVLDFWLPAWACRHLVRISFKEIDISYLSGKEIIAFETET